MNKKALFGASLAALLTLAACGGDDGSSTDTTAAAESTDTTAAAAEGVSLAGSCPETVVFQTDWNPEAEHGFLYNLVGEGYSVNTEKLSVTGPLVVEGQDTGVKVEVRAGGPATGYQSPLAMMYQDPAITAGFISTDEAVSQSVEKPSMTMVAPFNINPQIIMWDPATYPNAKAVADLKADKVKIRYFDGAAYMDYLVEAGIVDKAQADATYDGTPANFLAAGGKDAQQGFGTAEPYFYQEVLADWKKPVAYQYIHDAGWTAYAQSIGATMESFEANKACWPLLVPAIQKSQREYIASPDRANALVLDLVQQYNNGWAYDAGQASAAVAKMQEDKLVANSPDGVLGSFDLDRVTAFIEKATPIYTATGAKVKEGLTPADLVTNEFIDSSIALP